MKYPRVRRPCDECPFRTDVRPGNFPPERFKALREAVGGPGREAALGAPMFACHKTPAGEERACAGWLVVCGADHLKVRVALLEGALPLEALEAGLGWPPLYDSYEEMEMANRMVPRTGIPVPTKPSTLDGPVARVIFEILTEEWLSSSELALQVLRHFTPNRHAGITREHVRAVAASLCRGGYLDSKLDDGVAFGDTRARKLVYYKILRRPEE